MPKFAAMQTYSAAIPVKSGDIVQNVGTKMIFVCPGIGGNDDNAVEVPPGEGVTISVAEQIRVRSPSRQGSTFKVIEGL